MSEAITTDTRVGSEAAFPLLDHNGTSLIMREPGLAKRELFAAMALQGLRANAHFNGTGQALAELAVKDADALLKELAK
jgi:hypothetical protein